MKRWNVRLEVENLDNRLVPSVTQFDGLMLTEGELLPAVKEGELVPAVNEVYNQFLGRDGGETGLIGLLHTGDENGLIGLLREGDENGIIAILRKENYVGDLYGDLLNRELNGNLQIVDLTSVAIDPAGQTGLPAVQNEELDKYFEQFLNRDDTGDDTVTGGHGDDLLIGGQTTFSGGEDDDRQP